MPETIEETNVRLMRRWYQEVWNERREAALDELCDPAVRAYGVTDEPLDFDGFKAAWRGLLETVDEFHIEVEHLVAEGDTVAARLTLTGVHVGLGFGIAASGKPLRFAAQVFTQWKDGKVAAGWNVIDMAAAYRQIGAQVI